MDKIIFKQGTVPFFIKIEVDGQEILERHDLSFAQGALLPVKLSHIMGELILEYDGMFAYFDEDVMEIVDTNNIGRGNFCCG